MIPISEIRRMSELLQTFLENIPTICPAFKSFEIGCVVKLKETLKNSLQYKFAIISFDLDGKHQKKDIWKFAFKIASGDVGNFSTHWKYIFIVTFLRSLLLVAS